MENIFGDLLIELINSIDEEKSEFEKCENINEEVLGFCGWYVLCNKDSKNLSKVWLDLKKQGMPTSDYRLKNLIFSWLQIPFNYSLMPIDVYRFLQEASKLITLTDRIDNLSEFIATQKQKSLN